MIGGVIGPYLFSMGGTIGGVTGLYLTSVGGMIGGVIGDVIGGLAFFALRSANHTLAHRLQLVTLRAQLVLLVANLFHFRVFNGRLQRGQILGLVVRGTQTWPHFSCLHLSVGSFIAANLHVIRVGVKRDSWSSRIDESRKI